MQCNVTCATLPVVWLTQNKPQLVKTFKLSNNTIRCTYFASSWTNNKSYISHFRNVILWLAPVSPYQTSLSPYSHEWFRTEDINCGFPVGFSTSFPFHLSLLGSGSHRQRLTILKALMVITPTWVTVEAVWFTMPEPVAYTTLCQVSNRKLIRGSVMTHDYVHYYFHLRLKKIAAYTILA